MSRYCYRYCGLAIDSAVPLPLVEADVEPGAARVTIDEGEVPAALAGARERIATWESDGEAALWRLPGVLAAHVLAGGHAIRIARAPGADAASVAAMLLGPVFALAAALRGDWLLNAAAVAREGEVTALIGWSAAGKSTAAAALVRHAGYRLVADSLLRLRWAEGGAPLAEPQGGGMLLWPDSVAALAIADADCTPVRPGVAALRWNGAPVVPEALPLRRISWLPSAGEWPGSEPGTLRGAAAIDRLIGHSATAAWQSIGHRRANFGTAAKLVQAVPVIPAPRAAGLRALEPWTASFPVVQP